ncbi:hypothetical protein ScPMuIL_011108 [Solemya velum]
MSHSRFVVKLYEKYTSKSPVVVGALYLRPLKKPQQGDDRFWYMQIAIGAHTLSKTVPRLCEEAGLEGYFTNHSLRASCASRLFENGVDEQLIMERTGHRSLAVRQYKRTSNKLVRSVSDIVVDDKKRQYEDDTSECSTNQKSCKLDTKNGGVVFNLYIN